MSSKDQFILALDEFSAAHEKRYSALETRLEQSLNEISQQQNSYGPSHIKGSSLSLGDMAVRSFTANRDIFEKSGTVRLEIKAATDAVTTAEGRMIASGGVGAPQGGVLGIQNALIRRESIGTSALEYSRYTGLEGAAALQATEGGDKAAVRPDHNLISQSSLTLAGYTVMSRQALSDSTELRNAVEITLSRSVATALDALLWDGSVTPAWTGLEALAAPEQTTYDTLADSVSDVAAGMQEAGFQPNAVVMSPATWVQVMALRADSGVGLYLSGSYIGQIEPVLRGLPVTLSPSIPAGKALVMDSAHIELLTVQNPLLQIGTTGSQFTQNLATLLLEMRFIPVFRTAGAAVLAVPSNVSV